MLDTVCERVKLNMAVILEKAKLIVVDVHKKQNTVIFEKSLFDMETVVCRYKEFLNELLIVNTIEKVQSEKLPKEYK